MSKTWEEIKADEPGTIYVDQFKEGLRFIVIRGPCALCAYIGLPPTHPLANMDYDDLPVNCHGGLTFAGEGDGTHRPKGYYWYGWDYGHAGDYSFYYDDSRLRIEGTGKQWLPDEVEKDAWEAIYDMQTLARLAETIYHRATGTTLERHP